MVFGSHVTCFVSGLLSGWQEIVGLTPSQRAGGCSFGSTKLGLQREQAAINLPTPLDKPKRLPRSRHVTKEGVESTCQGPNTCMGQTLKHHGTTGLIHVSICQGSYFGYLFLTQCHSAHVAPLRSQTLQRTSPWLIGTTCQFSPGRLGRQMTGFRGFLSKMVFLLTVSLSLPASFGPTSRTPMC